MHKIYCEGCGKHIANLVDGKFKALDDGAWGMSDGEKELCKECLNACEEAVIKSGLFVKVVHDLYYGLFYIGPFAQREDAESCLTFVEETRDEEGRFKYPHDSIHVVTSKYLQSKGRTCLLNNETMPMSKESFNCA